MVKSTKPAQKPTDDDASLKRLGGGRWATRDGRFTIEPQSGTWVVVDADQSDELGLPLVRGPFGSLTAAKAAIAQARSSLPAASPLDARSKAIRRQDPARVARLGRGPRAAAHDDGRPAPATRPAPPPEPAWLAGLDPVGRRRARRLIERLTAAGAPDAEGIARRDLVGDVPAVAAFALTRAIRDLGAVPSPETLVGLLATGADDDLEVRWRLVDGTGRAISLDPRSSD